jgi:predicted negative regulator of RcsB-dependent stress response
VAEHETEEEQIEALKRWWAEFGNRVMLVLGLVVCSYGGWQYVDQQQRERAEIASNDYSDMLDILDQQPLGTALETAVGEQIVNAAQDLKSQHENSGYAHLGALAAARVAVEQGDLDTAAAELQWALEHNPDKIKERVVRLRLARVEAARGNFDAALALVQGIDPGALKSLYEEAKGDFYAQQGNAAAALTAYEAAVESNDSRDNVIASVLQMKLDQVTVNSTPPMPADETAETLEGAAGASDAAASGAAEDDAESTP